MTRSSQLLSSAVVAIALAVGGTAPAHAQQPACLDHDDAAAALRRYAQFLVQATDSAHVGLRNKLQVPVIDTAQVRYVEDSKVCAAIARAVNTAFRKPDFVGPLYVLVIGTIYVAQDPSQRAGEWTPSFTVTREYRYIGMVAH